MPEVVNGVPVGRLAELARVAAAGYSEPHPFNIRVAVGSDAAANKLAIPAGVEVPPDKFHFGDTTPAYVVALDGHFACNPPKCVPSGFGATATTLAHDAVRLSTMLLAFDLKTLRNHGMVRLFYELPVDMTRLGQVYSIASDAAIYPEAISLVPPPSTTKRSGRACAWQGSHRSDDGGTSGFVSTVIGLRNVGAATCGLPTIEAVWGRVTTSGGGWVAATPGSYFPIGPASKSISVGDRVEFVVSTERLDDCGPVAVSRPVGAVVISLSDGTVLTVTLPGTIEAGCRFGFSKVGSWA